MISRLLLVATAFLGSGPLARTAPLPLYFRFNLGTGFYSDNKNDLVRGRSLSRDTDGDGDAPSLDFGTTVALTAGWQFHRILAVEAGYTHAPEISVTRFGESGVGTVRIGTFSAGPAARLPLGKRWSFNARGGGHAWFAKFPFARPGASGTDIYWGTHLRWKATTAPLEIGFGADQYVGRIKFVTYSLSFGIRL